MVQQLKTLSIKDNWLTEYQFTSLGKLLFINGYHNLQTGTFYINFNSQKFFMYSIHIV